MKRRRSSARPFFNELARLRAGVPCARAVRRVNERRSNRFQEVRGHYQSQSPDNHSSRCDSSLTLTLSLSFSLLSWMYAGLQLFFFFPLLFTHYARSKRRPPRHAFPPLQPRRVIINPILRGGKRFQVESGRFVTRNRFDRVSPTTSRVHDINDVSRRPHNRSICTRRFSTSDVKRLDFVSPRLPYRLRFTRRQIASTLFRLPFFIHFVRLRPLRAHARTYVHACLINYSPDFTLRSRFCSGCAIENESNVAVVIATKVN